MWKVDIYLETDSTFQGKRQRKCGYVLATTVHGEEKTKESFGISNGTYHQATLQTLIEALSRMTVRAQICIHTQDNYVASRLSKLEEMAGSGYLDTKNSQSRTRQSGNRSTDGYMLFRIRIKSPQNLRNTVIPRGCKRK